MVVSRRLVVVCQDTPFPALSGGRLEMWTRLRAWRQLGAELHVVFWTLGRDEAKLATEALLGMGCSVSALHRERSLWSLIQRRLPPLAYSMRPRRSSYDTLRKRVEGFAPDAIVLEGWPGVLTAWRLATELSCPILYRSQNVEGAYWTDIVAASSPLERVRLGFTARRIERLERAVRRAASVVLDISADDSADAESAGMRGRSRVLPPLWEASSERSEAEPSRVADADVVFGGSLWPPHHVEGIRWLILEVLPLVRARAGRRVTVRVVGSRPTADVLRLTDANDVECLADVAEFRSELLRGKVLVNPVRRSSGVNMKMLELLTSGRPVVSTTAGVRGLSERVRRGVVVADDADEFASAILRQLESARVAHDSGSHEAIREEYGVSAQRRFLGDDELWAQGPVGALLF